MNRKPVLYAVLVLLVVFAAACGGQAAPQPAPTAAPAPKQEAPKPAPTEAPKAVAPTEAPKVAPTQAPAPTAAPAPKATEAQKAAAPAVKAPEKNIVRINTGTYPDNLDPQQMSFLVEIGVAGMLYEGLVQLDTDLKAIPGAAESWKVSEDGKTYTFKLRAGLKYSDGKPLTAKNFEYAFKRAADPIVAGQYQSSTFDIEGAEEYGTADPKTTKPEDLQKLRDKVGVKAIDDTTLEIKLNKKASFFPYIAYQWFGYPVREDIVAKDKDTWWTKAENHVGNGPFILKELKEKEIARFVPNPNWRGTKAAAEEIIYRFITDSKVSYEAYKNGELDIIPLAAEDKETAEKDAVLSKEILIAPGSCSTGLIFNQVRPPFDKRDVRLAFAKAVDRNAWAKDVLRDLAAPSLSWMPDGIPGAKADSGAAQKFDPTEAKALLAKAGFADGKGLAEIKLTYSSTPRNKIRNEFLAAQFQKNLGVAVVLDPVEPTTLTALTKDVKTQPQISIQGWCSDYPDPQNWLTTYWRSTAFAKRYGYSNAENDKLMDAADVEADNAKRLSMYQQAEKTILETDVAIATLHKSVTPYLIKPYVAYGKVTSHDIDFPGWFEPWKLTFKR